VSGQFQAWIVPPVTTEEAALWAPEPMWTSWRSEPRLLSRPILSVVVMLNELS